MSALICTLHGRHQNRLERSKRRILRGRTEASVFGGTAALQLSNLSCHFVIVGFYCLSPRLDEIQRMDILRFSLLHISLIVYQLKSTTNNFMSAPSYGPSAILLMDGRDGSRLQDRYAVLLPSHDPSVRENFAYQQVSMTGNPPTNCNRNP